MGNINFGKQGRYDMKYEIQKRSTTDPHVWYMVAQADTKEWAEKISESLNICDGGEFRFEKK